MTTNAVIAFTPKGPSQAFVQGAGLKESLSDGIGSSYAVIHYQGKTWSIQHRGERYHVTREDDGTAQGFLDVIILKQAEGKSKSYYPGGWSPTQEAGKKPTCASLNGITPDSDAPQPQSQTCALCPRNEWKINPENGKKFRECSDFKRIAVLILPSITQRIMGTQLMEPAFLRVPPASLNGLATYGDGLNAQGYPYCSVVTRLTFDPTKSHPEFLYKAVQELTDAEAPVILPLRDGTLTQRIVGSDQRALPRPLGSVTTAPALASPGVVAAPLAMTNNPAPTTATPAVQATTTVAAPVAVDPPPGALGLVTAAPLATASPSSPIVLQGEILPPEPKPAPTGPISTGILDAGPAPTGLVPAQRTEVVAQNPADTGTPIVADPNIDARVAAVLAAR